MLVIFILVFSSSVVFADEPVRLRKVFSELFLLISEAPGKTGSFVLSFWDETATQQNSEKKETIEN